MAKSLADKPEDWAKAVGIPDSWDKKNIEALVNTFLSTSFSLPKTTDVDGPRYDITGREWVMLDVATARKEFEHDNDFAETSKQMQMRKLTLVPRPLYVELIKGYPTLFRDAEQHMWFARNFPIFRIPRRI